LELSSPGCEHDFSLRTDCVDHAVILKLNAIRFQQARVVRDPVTEEYFARFSSRQDLEIGTVWLLE
jgi:hypothetical protein